MTNASRDNNRVTTIIGMLNTDGTTLTPIKINPSGNALKVDDGTTGSDSGPSVAGRDTNFVTSLFAESSAGDGALVALYADSNGNLLINSN